MKLCFHPWEEGMPGALQNSLQCLMEFIDIEIIVTTDGLVTDIMQHDLEKSIIGTTYWPVTFASEKEYVYYLKPL